MFFVDSPLWRILTGEEKLSMPDEHDGGLTAAAVLLCPRKAPRVDVCCNAVGNMHITLAT